MNAKNYQTALIVIGHAFFLSMIVISIVFYKERMLNFDSAYYVFNMIMAEDFYIAHQRYISYFSQWLPLLGIKTGASLKTILILYSFALTLLYYILYNIATHIFRNPAGGLFIAFALVMTMRYKFWMAVSETPSTLAFAALLIAWLSADKTPFPYLKKGHEFLINCGLILLVALGHPLIVLPIGCYYAFDYLYHKKWSDWAWYATLAFTVVVYAYRLFAIQTGSYESNRISILENAEDILLNLNDYFVTQIVWRFLEVEYHLTFLVFILLTGILIYKKQILSAIWLWVASAGLLALVIVTCSYLNGKIYGLIDGYFGWIGFVWSIPFLFLILKTKKHYTICFLLTVFLLGYSWQRTLDQRKFFQKRMDFYSQIMEDYRSPTQAKFIVPAPFHNWNTLWYQWAIGVETLLMSSIKGPEHATIVYMQDWFDKAPDSREDTGDWLMHVKFAPFKYKDSDLPSQYFQLPTGKYQEVHPKQRLDWEVKW